MLSHRTKLSGTNFRGKRLPQACHAPQALVPLARGGFGRARDLGEGRRTIEGLVAQTMQLCSGEFKKFCLSVQKIFLTSDLKSSTKALVLSKRLPGLSSFCVKSKGSRHDFQVLRGIEAECLSGRARG